MTSKVVAVESSVQGSFLVRAERLRASEVVAGSLVPFLRSRAQRAERLRASEVVAAYPLKKGFRFTTVLNALGHLRWLQSTS